MPATAIVGLRIEAQVRPQRAIRFGGGPIRLTEHHEPLAERSPRPTFRFDHLTHHTLPV
jgi:hypothetical protein